MSGARSRSPGRPGVVAVMPAAAVLSANDYKMGFVFVGGLAMSWAVIGKTEGALVIGAAFFFIAIACQCCFDLKADTEHFGLCVGGCTVIVVLCAWQIHETKVYTSAKEPMEYASVDFAVLKRVLHEIPACVKAAKACEQFQEEVAYLHTLSLNNLTGGNITLDWPQWLFVMQNSLRKAAP